MPWGGGGGGRVLPCQAKKKMAGEILQKKKWRAMVEDTIEDTVRHFELAVCRITSFLSETILAVQK